MAPSFTSLLEQDTDAVLPQSDQDISNLLGNYGAQYDSTTSSCGKRRGLAGSSQRGSSGCTLTTPLHWWLRPSLLLSSTRYFKLSLIYGPRTMAAPYSWPHLPGPPELAAEYWCLNPAATLRRVVDDQGKRQTCQQCQASKARLIIWLVKSSPSLECSMLRSRHSWNASCGTCSCKWCRRIRLRVPVIATQSGCAGHPRRWDTRRGLGRRRNLWLRAAPLHLCRLPLRGPTFRWHTPYHSRGKMGLQCCCSRLLSTSSPYSVGLVLARARRSRDAQDVAARRGDASSSAASSLSKTWEAEGTTR